MCLRHSQLWFQQAQEWFLYANVILTRMSVITTRARLISTRRVWFYTQSVIFTHTRVILTRMRVNMTLTIVILFIRHYVTLPRKPPKLDPEEPKLKTYKLYPISKVPFTSFAALSFQNIIKKASRLYGWWHVTLRAIFSRRKTNYRLDAQISWELSKLRWEPPHFVESETSEKSI
jgi:heme/copper-type cytochrome/quinol oxidase subunit 1